MLLPFPAIAEPNLFKPGVELQIIDVPVGMLGAARVMSQPGTHTSRPEGAANIDVKSRLKPQMPEPSDRDYGVCR
jgi:hypothetical protein